MPCFIFTEFTKRGMSVPILSELNNKMNEQMKLQQIRVKCKTPASQRGLDGTILYNHFEVDACHCY